MVRDDSRGEPDEIFATSDTQLSEPTSLQTYSTSLSNLTAPWCFRDLPIVDTVVQTYKQLTKQGLLGETTKMECLKPVTL